MFSRRSWNTDNVNDNSGGDSINEEGEGLGLGLNDNNNNNKTWQECKEEGRIYYETNNQYSQALSSFRNALLIEKECPSIERQILLSNVVACRLKIGGRENIDFAVEESKECIAINDKWAKGHVRLASSYIALDSSIIGNNNNDSTTTTGKQNQRTHSNDACNSLQRALSLDSSNRTARQMLTHELKARDNSNASNVSSATNGGGARTSVNGSHNHGNASPEPSAPPVSDSTSYSSSTPLSSSTPFTTTTTTTTTDNNNNNDDLDIDTSSPYESWEARFHFQWSRVLSWYESLSEDIRTLVKVLLGLVLLYVAFGGRFGLGYVRNGITDAMKDTASRYDYGNSNGKGCIQGGAGEVGGRGGTCENSYGSKGNYGVGNAYDQYWERKNKGRNEHSTYHDISQRQAQWSHGGSNYDDDEIVDTNDASADKSYGSYQEDKEDLNSYNDDNDGHNTQRSHNNNEDNYHQSSEHYTNHQQQQKQKERQQQRHHERHHSNHQHQHYQSHHQSHQHHSHQQHDNVMMIYQYVALVMLLVGTVFSVIFRSNNGMPRPFDVDSTVGEAAGEAGVGGVGTARANTSTRSTGDDDDARNNDNMMNEGFMGNVRRGMRMGLGLGMGGIGMRRMGMRGMGGMGMGMGMGMGGMGMGGMGGFGRMGLFRRLMMVNRAMQMNDVGRGGGGYNARRRRNRWW